MTDLTIHRTREPAPLDPPADSRPLGGRLGLDVPRETWPTAPELKRLEACGYGWIQMHAPPAGVRRIGSVAVGMACDLGHAHLTAQLAGLPLVDVLAGVIDETVLFHVHDNLGRRRGPGTPPGIVPLRLDLHMPPGRGTLPWQAIAPLLRTHPAPLLMEVAPAQRPDPLRLATVSAELLTRG